MTSSHKRRRGTAIVETEAGIIHILNQFWDYRAKNTDLFKMLQKY